MKQNRQKLFKNLLLLIVGFCLYITCEVIFRSYSFVLMGICGGVAFVVIDKVNDCISWNIPLFFQMLIGGTIITLIELAAGLFSLKIIGIRMWDYSGMWGSTCHDLICPLFSFVWFLLSGICIILADAINYYVIHELSRPYYRLFLWNGKQLFLPKRICKTYETIN